MHPIHHIQKRKKQKLHPYPSNNNLIRGVDSMVYIAGLAIPGLTFIQAYKIWAEKDAAGVSFAAYAGFIVANIVWLSYGVIHKQRPIILMYILLIIFNASVVAGTIMYGGK